MSKRTTQSKREPRGELSCGHPARDLVFVTSEQAYACHHCGDRLSIPWVRRRLGRLMAQVPKV